MNMSRVPQIPVHTGARPTISDASLYIDPNTQEALPQTDQTRQNFPDYSSDWGGAGIGGRGNFQSYIHQETPSSKPSLYIHDIAASNFASKDSGEFSAGKIGSRITEGAAKTLSWLGGSRWKDRQSPGVNVGGVSHRQGSLSWDKWPQSLKDSYPQFKSNQAMRGKSIGNVGGRSLYSIPSFNSN